MLVNMIIGILVIGLNVIIHAFALDFIIQEFEQWDYLLEKILKRRLIPFISALVIFGVLISNCLQIWIWAGVYLLLPHMPFHDLATALYLSASTMTTLGVGDVTMPAQWRLLFASESINGFVVFGWSTAFIFEVISQLYRREAGLLPPDESILSPKGKKPRYEDRKSQQHKNTPAQR